MTSIEVSELIERAIETGLDYAIEAANERGRAHGKDAVFDNHMKAIAFFERVQAAMQSKSHPQGDEVERGEGHDLPAPPATLEEYLDGFDDETGWLVEEQASGIIHWIALAKGKWPRTKQSKSVLPHDRYLTPIERVKDANAALRFARKEDAEAFIELFDFFLLDPVATEHCWPSPTRAALVRSKPDDVRERVAIALFVHEHGSFIEVAPEWEDDREHWLARADAALSAIGGVSRDG